MSNWLQNFIVVCLLIGIVILAIAVSRLSQIENNNLQMIADMHCLRDRENQKAYLQEEYNDGFGVRVYFCSYLDENGHRRNTEIVIDLEEKSLRK